MRLGLVFSEVGQGLRRNLSMVISVVLVTFISLTFVGAAVLLQMQITQMKSYWFDRAQVAVYLCTEFSTVGGCDQQAATPDQVALVEAQLESATLAPFIDTFYFETQEEAFARFQDQFAGQAVADLITPELLPQAFWVNLVDPTQSDILVDALGGLVGVESIVDQRSYLEQIFAILNAASFTAIGIAALMLVAAALLIATTIRLSAFSRAARSASCGSSVPRTGSSRRRSSSKGSSPRSSGRCSPGSPLWASCSSSCRATSPRPCP